MIKFVDILDYLQPGDYIMIVKRSGVRHSGKWLEIERIHPFERGVIGKVLVKKSGVARRGTQYTHEYRTVYIKEHNLDEDAGWKRKKGSGYYYIDRKSLKHQEIIPELVEMLM